MSLAALLALMLDTETVTAFARPLCRGVSFPGGASVGWVSGGGGAVAMGCATNARVVCASPLDATLDRPFILPGETVPVRTTSAVAVGDVYACRVDSDQGAALLRVVVE